MSNKFKGSSTYARGVSVKKKNPKKGVSAKQSGIAYTAKPNRKRKTLSDGRVRTVRTNKDGRKVVRVKSASGALLKIRKGATDTKKKVAKTFSAGGRYVKRVSRGSGASRVATTYKGRLRKSNRGSGAGVNQGKGVMVRRAVGSKMNRRSNKFTPKNVGGRYVPVKQKIKRK